MLGGNKTSIQGPCFQNTDNVMCRFIDKDTGPTTPCQYLDRRTVSCVVPILLRIGRVYVFLSIDGGATFGFQGIYTSVSVEDVTDDVAPKVELDTDGKYPKVVWPNDALAGSYYDIDVYVYFDGSDSTDLENDKINVANNIVLQSSGDLEFEINLNQPQLTTKHVGFIRISQGDEEGGKHSFALSIWSDPFDYSIFTSLNVPKWCISWGSLELQNPVKLSSSNELKCPCNLQSALVDRGHFSPSPRCSNTVPESCSDEVDIAHCVRSRTPSSEGHGLECCYDANGALTNIADNKHAGYSHRYHHLGRQPFDEIGRVPYLSYFLHDILPYRRCCKDHDSCLDHFIPARPSQDCSGYQPPRPARMNGDPHIQTLDGLAYTFNGHGEYILMNSLDGMFMMQGRTEPIQVTGNITMPNATRFTAIAAQYNDGTKVHVSLNQIRGLTVHVTDRDNKWFQIKFDLTPTWYDAGVTIVYTLGTNVKSVSVTVAFDFGLVFTVEAANDIMSIQVLGPHVMRDNTSGLLGNWNNDFTDDLQTPDGDYLPSNSSIRDIHHDFGEKWRVAAGDSVFYYGAGTAYETYSDPNFQPWFELPNNIDPVKVFEVCGDNSECIFDYQVTGNVEIAKMTKQGVESFEEVLDSVKPVVVCGFIPTPDNGIKDGSVYTEGGVLVFECNDGYNIANGESTIYCTQEGFWSGSVSSCVKNDNYVIYIAIGIGIGILGVLVILQLICCYCCRRRFVCQTLSYLYCQLVKPFFHH
ncbi:sushi domain-containing protein 2-like [Anneissia japonica]|uniref:sushi domain-containing protein 2-like n=1 Tax=Anneissia japonica TaxID=1529436 RepID=UPI0014259B57|nr:sushi domain-containing protein 2-like [Anneissia japonica]